MQIRCLALVCAICRESSRSVALPYIQALSPQVYIQQMHFFQHMRSHFQPGAPIRSRIRDLVPNGTKVPKWSQKSPDFASKSQISDSTFRCCWKEGAHSSKVTAVPYLDIHNVSCACISCYLALSFLLTIRYILKWKMSRQRIFLPFSHVFCIFMKITT